MRRGAAVLAIAAAAAGGGAVGCAAPATAPRICALGEGERAHGRAACTASESSSAVELRALLEETVAFQIVIDDPAVALDGITIEAPPFLRPGAERLPVDVFVEHFVDVVDRSRNDREAGEALPFTLRARPSDRDTLGAQPDALIPLSIAGCKGEYAQRGFCPYPLRVEKGARGAFWLDVFVPRDAPVGRYTSHLTVRRKGAELATFDASLVVSPAVLPFEAARFFAFEAFDSLEPRFVDPPAVERSLLQLLHAHHVDGFPAVTEKKHLARLGAALDGSLFAAGAGYRGPGVGAPLSILPIGAYGSMGPPTDVTVVRAKRLAADVPKTTETFLYAVDERCESSLGPDWIKELERISVGDRLKVAHTCDRDPINQRVDIVMTPAQAWDGEKAKIARKPVYAYNGRLPFAGPLMLDAPLTSLTANGWIAALHGVPRWFLWETIFWNDGNEGGAGPHDVFADPETFHNADGDTALYDGLLLYPGRSPYASDLAVDAVLPSMRLKAVRRGIQDAGLVALAASRDPERTRELVRSVASGALSDATPDGPTHFATDPDAYARARAGLRDIIADSDVALTPDEVQKALAQVSERTARPLARRGGAFLVGVVASLLALSVIVVGVLRRRSSTRGQRGSGAKLAA